MFQLNNSFIIIQLVWTVSINSSFCFNFQVHRCFIEALYYCFPTTFVQWTYSLDISIGHLKNRRCLSQSGADVYVSSQKLIIMIIVSVFCCVFKLKNEDPIHFDMTWYIHFLFRNAVHHRINVFVWQNGKYIWNCTCWLSPCL